MEYTMELIDAAYDCAQETYETDDYATLLDFLNSSNFRTFGEALESIIRRKMPADCTLSPKEFLQKRCKETGITVASASTLRNWFNGTPRPKKDAKSREDMFALSFVLGLTTEEAKTLFHDAYLDRAYNKRNYRELIYYYCLKNKHDYAHAQKLISMVSFSEDIQDSTIYTAVLSAQADSLLEDTQLIAYINNHPHNFHLNNISAFAEYERLLETASLTVDKELGFLKRDSAKIERTRGDWDSKRLADLADKNINSAAFDFEVITGQSITGVKGTEPLSFKNTELPKEIKTNFPATPYLDKDSSTEQLRKMIILLFSYDFWYKVQQHHAEDFFGDYLDLLDDLLNRIGYPPMYYGNPYDWLFLACSNTPCPLDTFRNILSEILISEE